MGDLVLSTAVGSSRRLSTGLCDTGGFNLRVLKWSPENHPGFNVIFLGGWVGVCARAHMRALLADMFILFVLLLFVF